MCPVVDPGHRGSHRGDVRVLRVLFGEVAKSYNLQARISQDGLRGESLGAKFIAEGKHPTPVSLIGNSLTHLQADTAREHLCESPFIPQIRIDAQVLMHRGELPRVASHRECDTGLPQDEVGHPAHLVNRVEVGLLKVHVGNALEVVCFLEIAAILSFDGQAPD